jgi:hypothetical protein
MGISAYANLAAADGGTIRAGDVKVGDILREALTGKALRVLNVWQGPAVGMFHLDTLDGASLDLTEDHPLDTDRGCLWACEVTVGVRLRTPAGWTECCLAERLAGDFMVYDIKLEKHGLEDSWLIANGLAAGA